MVRCTTLCEIGNFASEIDGSYFLFCFFFFLKRVSFLDFRCGSIRKIQKGLNCAIDHTEQPKYGLLFLKAVKRTKRTRKSQFFWNKLKNKEKNYDHASKFFVELKKNLKTLV